MVIILNIDFTGTMLSCKRNIFEKRLLLILLIGKTELST